MTNIVLLDTEAHRTLKVQAGASAALGDNERFIQVVVREFPLLAVHYPILFSKDTNTGGFYCGVMLGFDVGENLFLGDGGRDAYRPLNLQRLPFYASTSGLGIDLDSPRVDKDKGEPLFTDSGEPTPYLQSVVTLFNELRPGIEQTNAFIAIMLQHNLIEPIELDIGFDDGGTRKVQGLYTINQEALRALPDATIVDLFRRGYLQLVYLMIASLKQIPVLAQKKNRRLLD
ncbi:MAG: SapC family protein [Pseudomonadota bacterium]